MTSELKPCPFCNSEYTQVRWIGFTHTHNGAFKAGYRGECVGCLATTGAFDTEEEAIEAWNARVVDGETSDGYHTFNELYHHRAVLFSKVVQFAGNRAWKSKLHADGTMFDGYFIVGVETPEGQATYHYEIDPYWEMFNCKEMEQAPVWDGHTPQEAIGRIERWSQIVERTCKMVPKVLSDDGIITHVAFNCSACGKGRNFPTYVEFTDKIGTAEAVIRTHATVDYCEDCGAKVVGD